MAGGSGSRMGAEKPKQFLDIDGRPILQRTMEKFIRAVPDIKIVTVLPEPWITGWKTLCYKNNFIYTQTLVKGGFTRFHSVKNGLAKIPDGAVVAIHDGVRPLLSEGMISRLFAAARNNAGVIPIVPTVDTVTVLDTVKCADGSVSLVKSPGETADRSRLFAVQTPQIFHSEVIKQAYSLPFSPSFTDDGSVAEAFGVKLSYFPGERYNIKITTPDDLEVAKLVYSYSFSKDLLAEKLVF